jgi:hypothetical protein
MKTTTFESAKVGDAVWSFEYGWGTVIGVNKTFTYPLEVSFTKNFKCTYTLTGTTSTKGMNQTLFWDEIDFEIPTSPLPKLEVDTKVLVWCKEGEKKKKRYFSHFDEEGLIVTFPSGSTSWSSESTNFLAWNYWELPKQEI